MSSLPTIFISYSHKDSNYLAELLNAVEPTLSNVTTLKAWSDEEIASGDHWDSEILGALNAARAGVLLISNDFLNSTYIREKELPVLIPREQDGTLRLFVALAEKLYRFAKDMTPTRATGGAGTHRWSLSVTIRSGTGRYLAIPTAKRDLRQRSPPAIPGVSACSSTRGTPCFNVCPGPVSATRAYP